jgi:hypothetical protein
MEMAAIFLSADEVHLSARADGPYFPLYALASSSGQKRRPLIWRD